MEDNKYIDKIFTEGIDANDIKLEDDVWEKLEAGLNKKAEKKYRILAYRLFISLIGTIILLGAFITYHFATKNTDAALAQAITNPAKINSSTLANHLSMPKELFYQENKKVNQKELTKPISASVNTAVNTMLKENNNLFSKTQSSKQNSLHVKKTNFDVSKNFQSDNISLKNNNSSEKAINTTILNPTVAEIKKSETLISESLPSPLTQSNAAEKLEAIANNNQEKSDSLPSLSKTIPDDKPSENKKSKKLYVMGYFSPDFTGKFAKKSSASKSTSNSGNNNNNGNNNQDDNEDYSITEDPAFSFNTGFLVGYDLTSKWSIKLGASYSLLSQTIKSKILIAKTDDNGDTDYQFNTSYGSAVIPSDASSKPSTGDSLLIKSDSKQNLNIINIPILVKWQIQKNKFSFYAQAGLSGNYILNQKLKLDSDGKQQTVTEFKGLKKIYPGLIVGLGASYNVAKNISVLLEPTFRTAISPINTSVSKKPYPYSFGLVLGLNYHF